MDRRRAALAALLLFALCTGASIVLSGSRSGLEQGLAPALVQFVGYAFALAGGVLLLTAPSEGNGRTLGGLVLASVAVLVLLDLVVADGPDIGAGAVRLIGLVVIMVATVRLAQGGAVAGRAR